MTDQIFNDETADLTLFKIFKFWLPLSATWIMMSFEGPFLSAIIARMADPKFNLAAYGVAFSIALIIEAPVIMIMTASTALVKNWFSFKKLRNFIYAIIAVITIFMLIVIWNPVFYFITINLIELPKGVAQLTHSAVIILLPWPGVIGYRRFYQGILIRNNLTRRVAYGTVIRLISMSATAMLLFFFSKADGVVIGAASLSIGVTAEAIASRLMAYGAVKRLKSIEHNSGELISYKSILKFYYPLALTSILSFGVNPMVIFFLGQSKMAIDSLAVLPVLNALVFIFRGLGLSTQEVIIALMGKNRKRIKLLKKFSFTMGMFVLSVLGIIALTPLNQIWFNVVSGLSLALTHLAVLPLKMMLILPSLTVLISYQRGVLVYARKTLPITKATIIEVIGIIIVLFWGIKMLDAIGVLVAASAYTIGRLMANIYLFNPVSKSLKEFK